MDTAARLRAALQGALDIVEDASPVNAVEALTRGLSRILGAYEVAYLIVDVSGRALVQLTRADRREVATRVPYEGAIEQVMRTQVVKVLPAGVAFGRASGSPPEGWTVLAPVFERGEALGLLVVHLPAEPTDDVVTELRRAAHLLGYVMIASRRHTDLFEWGVRETTFSLSAEIQRRLLPDAFTCDAGTFVLSAWVEPCDDIGGDTFDYSLSRKVLHVSMTDAMGHGVSSSLIATLCVGSLRKGRRAGASLLAQASEANQALLRHRDDTQTEGFATGIVGRLDLATGVLHLINAGHEAPFLLREGVVSRVALTVDLPFGLFASATYHMTDVELQPGDRVVFVTDGMLERNAADLDFGGLVGRTAALHPREAARALADEVLGATGHALQDDATLLVLDWRGHRGERCTVAGATRPGERSPEQ